ncbi:hypothetical protein NDU88_001416 [Pleurodeles waltl]|uniref:Uncharacterized protein n=1 Tax=Pleurodeles waltl TaxID=8319 RepID=A0AAV7WID2_PLEWA|nr:hypothetical protein NDU88_001416 [Pleurodeles waltl]
MAQFRWYNAGAAVFCSRCQWIVRDKKAWRRTDAADAAREGAAEEQQEQTCLLGIWFRSICTSRRLQAVCDKLTTPSPGITSHRKTRPPASQHLGILAPLAPPTFFPRHLCRPCCRGKGLREEGGLGSLSMAECGLSTVAEKERARKSIDAKWIPLAGLTYQTGELCYNRGGCAPSPYFFYQLTGLQVH